jgi:hypothetical protein
MELLTSNNGTNKFSRNVGNYQYTLRNIPEERRPHLKRGGSEKSRKDRKPEVLS